MIKAHEFDYFADVLRATRLIAFMVQAVEQMMPGTSHRSFTESEGKYIATFGRRPDVPIDEPLQGTCTWSISTREYLDWLAEPRPAVLWLTGDAGCGKTVLTNFLVRELKDSVTPSSANDELVCCFFCARDIESQKDARSILRALILQILSVKKDVVRQIKAAYSSPRYEYEPSFETLWHIFEMVVAITSCSCLYIVIDALDECEEKSRSLFLAKFLHMVQPQSLDGEIRKKRIKLVISGQPLISRTWRVGDEILSQFYIDMEGRPEGLVRDLKRFVDYKVEDLVVSAICSEASGEQLKQKLYALTENSFLWLSMALEDLKQGLIYRDADLQRVLTMLPGNLKDSYTKHLRLVSESQLPRLRCYLQLLVACATPLTLFEFDIFTTLYDRQSTECISPVDGTLVLNSIRRALGPLVKFLHGKVKFIHPSTYGVDLDTAHLLLAKVCIQNLLQEAESPDDLDEESPSSALPSSSPISACSSKGEANQDAPYAELFNIEDVAFLRDENIIPEDVLSRLLSRFPAYDYVTQYWDHHYSQAEYLADASSQQDAIKLLSCGSPRLSRWKPLLDVHLCDKDGRNAMSYAAEKATLGIVRHLFHVQVSIAKEDANGRNAISWAANSSGATMDPYHCGQCVLEYLIEKCPDGVNSQDQNGWSPLAWALDRPGYLEAVQILIEKGKADVNQRDRTSGRSVLAWAASEGFAQIVEYLLGLPHLDKNATDNDGRSPLSYAAANVSDQGSTHGVSLDRDTTYAYRLDETVEGLHRLKHSPELRVDIQ
ncbi:hypothetical protein DV736_g5854, partial [Chaetothyriales sp. CBS 134916]